MDKLGHSSYRKEDFRGSPYPILSAQKNHKFPEQSRRLLVEQGVILSAPSHFLLGKVDDVNFVGVLSGMGERVALTKAADNEKPTHSGTQGEREQQLGPCRLQGEHMFKTGPLGHCEPLRVSLLMGHLPCLGCSSLYPLKWPFFSLAYE